jgi:LysM repeat protein
VTDETPKKRTRRPRAAPSAGVPPVDAGGVEDPDEALRRLESMGSAKAPGGPLDVAPLPPAPVVDSFSAPPTNRPQRPMGSSQRAPRSRPRPAAGPSSTRMVARIAFPVVFLIAVIALIGIVVQSGVMSSDEPSTTPTTNATKAGGSTSVTKKYVVQEGDSLSTIAARFNTSTSELMTLNPDLSGSSTVVVGQRIVVPRQ